MIDNIEKIDIGLLVPFKDHPFSERNGLENDELIQSIKDNGILEPIIVRPIENDKFEIISGHRRVNALKKLGVGEVSAIVKELTDQEAVIAMVDANLKREHILPSEKAFAYKMKLEAIKHQGKTTCGQLGTKLRSDELIAEFSDDSARQIQRYIRLTYLIPEILKLVDEDRMALTPAVELSYLSLDEQHKLYEQIEYADATPSLSQAQRLRRLSADNNFFSDSIALILNEEKPNQKEQLKFKTDDLKKYFPRNYTPKDMQEVIIKLLERWKRSRDKDAR
ncbi:ParB/RepB/Spo0J family partition protein [Traorella massiliensis]|uniref:ParB/RepB/Spo0J family partition protein n=1 Tax=Traorella massiliensis TaxID=1903263 RepID=UPI00235742C9|nr:ParB/RepB/Spo0J family partition protein [Traorella massiliensis]